MPQMHPTRLPSNMAIRVRAQVDPDTRLAWLEREGFYDRVSRHSPMAPPIDDPVDRYTAAWVPHEPHEGRRPPSKGVGNFRGSMVEGTGHELVLESTLERAAAVIGVAYGKKSRIRSQVGPVGYRDGEDKERHSTLDFAFGASDMKAVAVKPGRRVVSSGLEATVEAIREQRTDFFGKVEIWTEAELPRSVEHNASLILRCRRDRSVEDVAAMKRKVGDIAGSVKIGDLVDHSGLPASRAFVALVNLIDDGFIAVVPHKRIGYRAAVRRTH